MKGIDIFCASQAATAIRLTMEEGSSSSSSTSTIYLGGGGRAIDRYNPIIRDATRIGKVLTTPRAPCSSTQSPINPKPRKNPSKENHNHVNYKKIISSSSKKNDQKRKNGRDDQRISDNNSIIKKSSWSCTKPGEFISPPGSTRYLLSRSQKSLVDHVLSDFVTPPPALVDPPSMAELQAVDKKEDESRPTASKLSSSSSSSSPPSGSPDQVVVLRVSLHCKGCERKMRKHISRMEGVRSYDIDFAAKKLTVVGDVTPLAVLASVSKVKNAQLLTSPLASSIPSVCSEISEIKKDKGIVV